VHSNRSEALLLETHPVIARYIAETYLKAWEEELGRKIYIKEESDFSWSKYRLDYQGPVQQIEHKIELLREREADVVVHQSTSS
jgi:ribonuclease G